MGSLTAKIPNNEELTDLDSFDLAFCCATGHAHFVDVNDIMFETAVALKQAIDFKTVTLWGPETELLSRKFAKEWKAQSGLKLRAVRSAFDLSGDISVDKKRVNAALNSMKSDGKKVWSKMENAVLGVFDATVERADRHFERQLVRRTRRKQLTSESWASYVSEANGDHVATFTKAYPGRILHPEIDRLVKLVEADQAARLIDKAELANRIKKIDQMPARYFNGVSDVHVGRCWNYTGLQAAAEQKVTRYIWSAKRDRITCPVCRRLHGRTFDVKPAHGKMEKYLKSAGKGKPPDIIAKMMRFPRVKMIDNLSPEQVRKQGWQPPAHGRCRCDIDFLWKRTIRR